MAKKPKRKAKGMGSLVLRGRTWFARWVVDGRVFTRTCETSNQREAEDKLAEFTAPFRIGSEVETLEAVQIRIGGRKAELAKMEERDHPPPTLEHVWPAFLRSASRPDSGESTLRQYEAEWKRFRVWLAEHHPGVAHLHAVTPQLAADYSRNLTEAKVRASTFNQHRNFLRMLWRVLAAEARLASNPWDAITPRKLNALMSRKKALTAGQYDALLLATTSDPDLRDLFALLAWTGQRLVDVVTLQWGAVDFTRGVITLSPRKTARRQGKQVHIPLFPAAREVLDRREAGQPVNPAGHVFPTLVEEYDRDGGSSLAKRIGAAFKRAGMETTMGGRDKKAPKPADKPAARIIQPRGVTVYGAHSLRHFFVTAAASSGMPAAMIKSITGHATDSMLEHYQQIGADMAAEIAARMTASATPVTTRALQEGGNPLRAQIQALADELSRDNWQFVKTRLSSLANALKMA